VPIGLRLKEYSHISCSFCVCVYVCMCVYLTLSKLMPESKMKSSDKWRSLIDAKQCKNRLMTTTIEITNLSIHDASSKTCCHSRADNSTCISTFLSLLFFFLIESTNIQFELLRFNRSNQCQLSQVNIFTLSVLFLFSVRSFLHHRCCFTFLFLVL
jgi:hypothetical protein